MEQIANKTQKIDKIVISTTRKFKENKDDK